jgi:hypothetical protein
MERVTCLPTFVEHNAIPRDLMNWTSFGSKISSKCMVSSEDDICISKNHGCGLPFLAIVHLDFQRTIQMSGESRQHSGNGPALLEMDGLVNF